MAKRTPKTPAVDAKAIDTRDQREVPASWARASVPIGDSASSYYTNTTGIDPQLIARSLKSTVWNACNINATVLTAQPLRLYARAGAVKASTKTYARKVRDRKTLSYLDGCREYKPLLGKAAEYARRADGDVEEVISHPALDLLQNPCPDYTGHNFMWLTHFQREAAGRAFWYTGERANDIPTSLYPLFTAFCWPRLDENGLINGYFYGRNLARYTIYEPDVVMYTRLFPSLVHPAAAQSWVQSVLSDADLEAAALQSEIARWNNGGSPGMVLRASKETNDQQMKQMKANLESQVRGVGKAGSFLLLRDTELLEYAAKPHEMQYTQGMEATQKRIYDAAGIPEPIYRLNSANLASATVADRQYMRLTIAPRCRTFASEMTELYLPLMGIEPGTMWFAFDEPSTEDQALVVQSLLAGEAAGLVYPNEYRAAQGLEPLDDEQNTLRYRQTEAPAPMFSAFGGGQPRATEESEDEDESADEGSATGDIRGEDEENEESLKSRCSCGGGKAGGGCTPADGTKLAQVGSRTKGGRKSGDTYELTTKAGPRKVTLKAIEWDSATGVPKDALRAATRFENDLNAWYNATFPQMLTAGGAIADIPPAAMATFEAIVNTYVTEVLTVGGDFGAAMLNESDAFDVASEPAMAYVRERGLELATSVNGTMKETLQAALERTFVEGGSTADQIAAIRAEVPELSAYQAERLARTESANAFVQGEVEAWDQNGVEGKMWLLAGGPCPECQDIADRYPGPVPIRTVFTSTDGTWQGEAPTRHPNCRCDLSPEAILESTQ
jgi:phage portal protein BeeE